MGDMFCTVALSNSPLYLDGYFHGLLQLFLGIYSIYRINCQLCIDQLDHKDHIYANNSILRRREFGCNECPKIFTAKVLLKQHCLLVHKQKIEATKNYICKKCPEVFNEKIKLIQHKYLVHDKVKNGLQNVQYKFQCSAAT